MKLALVYSKENVSIDVRTQILVRPGRDRYNKCQKLVSTSDKLSIVPLYVILTLTRVIFGHITIKIWTSDSSINIKCFQNSVIFWFRAGGHATLIDIHKQDRIAFPILIRKIISLNPFPRPLILHEPSVSMPVGIRRFSQILYIGTHTRADHACHPSKALFFMNQSYIKRMLNFVVRISYSWSQSSLIFWKSKTGVVRYNWYL